MAGCNSGSCDSMVSTASNHSQRVSNPGVPGPARPSELRKDFGQISAQIRSPLVLQKHLEAPRQHQDQMNSCARALAAFPSWHVRGSSREPSLLQGLLRARTGSLQRLLCCQGCGADGAAPQGSDQLVTGSHWLRAEGLHLEQTAR